MASTVSKYFGVCGGSSVELLSPRYASLQRDFERLIGRPYAGETLVRDCQLFACGLCADCGRMHVSTRRVVFSKAPKLHRCNAICLGARGPNCSCACGGRNHGAGFEARESHPSLF